VVSQTLKAWTKKLFRSVGLDIRLVSHGSATPSMRDSIRQLLEQAKYVGFQPSAVIDIGAAHGSFARQCLEVFANTQYLLVEPLVEYQPILAELNHISPSIQTIFAAATAYPGEISIHVHQDLVGSSLYLEVEEGTDVNGVPRVVPAVTVDTLVEEAGMKGPFLLKVDVQGAELDVLKGAERVLQDCQYVILEVSFFSFFHNGADCCEIIAYMKQKGFVPYDIVELQYRPLDRALSQVDIAFVKEVGLFRRQHFYATPEQRDAQNKRLKTHFAGLFQWGQ